MNNDQCPAASGRHRDPETVMSAKPFASQADLQEKKTSFIKLSDNAYAYTAEGDPNSGVIIGIAMRTGSSRCRLIRPSCSANGPSS